MFTSNRFVIAVAVLGSLAGLLVPGLPPRGAAAAKPASLPPIPAGLPGHFSFGLFNTDTAWMTTSGVPWDTRYQYLAGGVNTGNGWANWNSPPGQYALNFIDDARASHTIPGFIYYQILQSAPHYNEFANLNDPATMRAYYDDFKLLMQKAAQRPGPLFVDLEPDLTGFMQQNPSNTADDAALQPTSVAASGQPDVAGYPNTFRGFYQALAHIRDVYAPGVLLGLDISTWGATDDVVLSLRANPQYNWLHHATRTATYLNSLGPGFQLDFFSPQDRDAAYYQQQGSNRWWDDTNTTQPTFDTMLAWLQTILTQTNKRALMWQVPNGNRVYRSENNTPGHWQDNRPEYFLNPANGRAHITQWANAGVLGLMFGAGAGDQSHYDDSAGDGITNPAPINGNTAAAQVADDDGGYIRLQTGAYYQQGPVPLPGGGPVPTATPATCTGFTDVHPTDYFYAAVQYLAAHGVIAGYADCTFRPYTATTRGQLAKIIVGAEGWTLDASGGPHFRDVPTTNPFYAFVETAYHHGVISGYSDGTFRWGANVTRGQLSKIVVMAADWAIDTSGGPHFRDVPPSNPFYGFVETAYHHNIISGYADGTFRVGASATRGQIAKIVYGAIAAAPKP